jgi:hypothetical protein
MSLNIRVSDAAHSYDRVVREHELAEDLQGAKEHQVLK